MVDVTEIPRFVKWAGGKSQSIKQFKPLFPTTFNNYFEPFVGGGAVAFHIIQELKPKKVILSDINKELINSFNMIETNVERLIIELQQHKEDHTEDGEDHYYEIRKVKPNSLPPLKRAARFIYLNRTCFNGLYRVNSKGEFNVPMGDYTNPDIVQEDKLRKISTLLEGVTIKAMSFKKIVTLAKEGDFIYFDPPYHPVNKGKSFTTYTKGNFVEKDQKKLAKVFRQLAEKGCHCMASNSDTEFIRELYAGFDIKTITARRMINSNAEGRGKVNELVIRNYQSS